MKRLLIGTILSLALLVPSIAHAGAATNAALGLGAFAVFNQMVGGVGVFGPRHYHHGYGHVYTPYYYGGPDRVVIVPPAGPIIYGYSTPMVSQTIVVPAPAPPVVQREVVYAHGRYILLGDGVTSAYQWVWVPNAPAPPAQ